MSSILIRDIPESTLQALKRRAARHYRSLQKEVVRLLEEAALMADPGEEKRERRLKLHKADERDVGTWSRDSIYGDDGR